MSSASSISSTRLSAPDTSGMYAASVNPPRRAKLQAVATLPTLLPSPATSLSPPPTYTAPSISPASDASQPQKKKRGRKPASGVGTSSRAAREATRKANHSRIEKARRCKINGALEELKALVPPDFHASPKTVQEDQDEDEDDDVDSNVAKKGSGSNSAKKAGEFKLDILERTVLFVRSLLQRVEAAEEASKSCVCRPNAARTGKRKAAEQEQERERDGPSLKRQKSGFGIVEEHERLSPSDGEDVDLSGAGSDSDEDEENEEVAELEAEAEESEAGFTISSSPLTTPRGQQPPLGPVRDTGVRLPSISELLASASTSTESGPFPQGEPTATTQLPSPSLSPYLFPRQRVSGSSSPTATRRTGNRLDRDKDWDSHPKASCPVGMSYLLTPPSATTFAVASSSAKRAPTLLLPSSALGLGLGSNGRVPGRDGPGEEEDAEAKESTHTATLALLQMRGVGREGEVVVTATGAVTGSGMTPGSLLGISKRS